MGGTLSNGNRIAAVVAMVTLALALALASAGTASARNVAGINPCPTVATYPWMGDSRGKAVQIPSLTKPNGINLYAGSVLRPADIAAYPGARPVVVLQHGNNGDQCRLWWLAQDLAGHGYVVVIWTVPSGNDVQNFLRSVDATRSAIAFAGSPANPFAIYSDPTRVAIGGSSLGAIVTSFVQGDGDPNVRAAMAFDNLVPGLPVQDGEDGGALCGTAQTAPVTPVVPALGFARDSGCGGNPASDTPDSKQRGFARWRDAGVPAMELVMRGFKHTDFGMNGTEAQRFDVSYYVLAWLDRWLGGNVAAENALLTQTVNGRPTPAVLSSTFYSAAFLPPRVDTLDLISWLALPPVTPDAKAPQTKRVHGPAGRVTSRTMKRHGLTFRFASTERGSTYQCRLNGKDNHWRSCRSPRKMDSVSLGRHLFFVRSIDSAGNVEPDPAKWSFRVVR